MKDKIVFYNWYGGKQGMLEECLAFIPKDTKKYYEPFMGSAVVLLNRDRCEFEYISDLDPELVYLIKMMADKEDGRKLKDRLKGIEYGKVEFSRAIRARSNNYMIKDEAGFWKSIDSLRKAEMIFILITQSFNSVRKNFRKGVSQETYRKKLEKNLDKVYKRLQGVHVECRDSLEVLKEIKGDEEAVVYLDPPYVSHLRGAKKVYTFEMGYMKQLQMLNIIKDSKCRILLSGYKEKQGVSLYDSILLPHGWKSYKASVLRKSCQTTRTKDLADEYFWCNYEIPKEAQKFVNRFSENRDIGEGGLE